jgi:hypothetical protein
MPCYHPLHAYKSSLELTERGKGVITFSRPVGPYEELKLPCGQCIGCRLAKSKEWALRCVHEASMHDDNCFLTLTYAEENLPVNGSLNKADYQKFLKRVRKRFPRFRFKYFLCGEYGSDLGRPHYHALLFGLDFYDKYKWCESNGNDVFRSDDLESLWPFGHSWIGDVTWQSAAYVARYVLKKANGDKAYERYLHDVDTDTGECRYLEPEFISMSRRPPVGKEWWEKFKADTTKDYLTHEGKRYKIPKYYDMLMEDEDVRHLMNVKQKRKEVARANAVDGLRLRQMEKHQELSAKRLERVL